MQILKVSKNILRLKTKKADHLFYPSSLHSITLLFKALRTQCDFYKLVLVLINYEKNFLLQLLINHTYPYKLKTQF